VFHSKTHLLFVEHMLQLSLNCSKIVLTISFIPLYISVSVTNLLITPKTVYGIVDNSAKYVHLTTTTKNDIVVTDLLFQSRPGLIQA